MDRGAWWATVHRVAKSRTRLKQLNTHAQFQDQRANKVSIDPRIGDYGCPALVVRQKRANSLFLFILIILKIILFIYC